MTPASPERLTPPFRAVTGDEACWVEDAAGRRFGFCYFDAKPLAGTGRMARLSPATARAMARLIARLPELVAKQDPGPGRP